MCSAVKTNILDMFIKEMCVETVITRVVWENMNINIKCYTITDSPLYNITIIKFFFSIYLLNTTTILGCFVCRDGAVRGY